MTVEKELIHIEVQTWLSKSAAKVYSVYVQPNQSMVRYKAICQLRDGITLCGPVGS